VTIKNNGSYKASAVGEVNVVELMKNKAIIGGEGNGELSIQNPNYGRDSLVGDYS
jgi:phosphomannomutase